MIDINTLHIGSTVSIGGKMQRVAAIDALNGQIGIDAYTTDAKGVKHPFGYKIEDVEPIPLTPELLAEFMPENGLSKNFGDFYVFVWKDNDYQIEIKIIGERVRVKINRDGYDGVFALATDIRYLHELEAFLYLTTKTELIKE